MVNRDKIAAAYAKSLGYTIGNRLDKGREGIAYTVNGNEGLVIRISNLDIDDYGDMETNSAKIIFNKLLGKKFKNIVNYYDIHKINNKTTGEQGYGILMERVIVDPDDADIEKFVSYAFDITYILKERFEFKHDLATKDYIPLVKNNLKSIYGYNFNDKTIINLLITHYKWDRNREGVINDYINTNGISEDMAVNIENYFRKKTVAISNEINKLTDIEKVKYIVSAWENLKYINNFIKRQLYGYFKESLALNIMSLDLIENNVGYDRNGNIKVFDISQKGDYGDVDKTVDLTEKYK